MLTTLTMFVLAQAATPAPVPAPSSDPRAKERKICENQEATGSILAHRVCRTRAEWDAIARARSSSVGNARNGVLDSAMSVARGGRGN